jgi:hypothetical protein
MRTPVAPKVVPTITTEAEAAALIQRLRNIIAELAGLVADETNLVRTAKVGRAAPVADAKAELSRRYMAELDCLRANADFVRANAPEALADFKGENDAFQKSLEINLAVLATAHAVAEGMMRTVASNIQAQSMPSGYGANGRKATPGRMPAASLAVSRQL